MEWEILMTEQVEQFLDLLYESDRGSHRLVNQAILVLERNGPGEGRPLVDSITASRLTNLKAGTRRWRDTSHLDRAIETAGGPEAFEAGLGKMLDEARGWRLAELRKRRDMTQEQVASRMGISVARVSQIEAGDVSTQEVLARYIAALGGTLKLIADFGDEQLKVA
jgi:DNA-binding XRE family transcriptional regulator